MEAKTIIIFSVILLWIVLTIISFIFLFGIEAPIFFDNCEKIMKIEYQTPTKDLTECVKAINHPIYNYYAPKIIIYTIILFTFIFSLMIIIWAIKEIIDNAD